jgi:hypothetical protein
MDPFIKAWVESPSCREMKTRQTPVLCAVDPKICTGPSPERVMGVGKDPWLAAIATELKGGFGKR